ncbi:di-heme-cytochrome C peroxidase [Motiliproteus sediminis]|uniref:di-heme-cytochrome C peroxidase n=1 Tax=Motiliproteus sediminis TaxID=1468178 RepID=UPI001AEF5048|nr:di-heme-cytochrome C peroxidase [Motiliproteus sediminis]
MKTDVWQRGVLLVGLLSVTLLSGCTYFSQGFPSGDHNGVAMAAEYFGDSAKQVVYLDQNWASDDSLWFYNTTQGSDLMPYRLFLHLRQPGSDELFRSDDNMNRLRYLVQTPSLDNGDGLPVGFVIDSYQGKDYVGLTCAACHTGQVNVRDLAIRIDGGPAMANFQLMFEELEQALEESRSGPRFEQLADDVLGAGADADKRAAFKQEVAAVYDDIRRYNLMNLPVHQVDGQPTVVDYGYGRLDAFGRIFNRIMVHLEPNQITNPANAPVSYPHLWGTPQHDFVQWNGIADNTSSLGFGPLGRNTGEVLGVFATFEVKPKRPGRYDYPSSVESRNQVRLESHLKDLRSPLWTDMADAVNATLPEPDPRLAIDWSLAEEGARVYRQFKCNWCHSGNTFQQEINGAEPVDRTDTGRMIRAQFSSVQMIGTDPLMATNALRACGDRGLYDGADLVPCGSDPLNTQQVAVAPALGSVARGVMTEGFWRKVGTFIAAFVDNPYNALSGKSNLDRNVDFEVANGYLNTYKGRNLHGIWATAPYLHNGSVPSLYDLFLPSCSDQEIAAGKACRPNRFTVGNRELDPEKVGFVQLDIGQYPQLVFDTSLPSNSNAGHEYAVGKTPFPKVDSSGKVIRDPSGKVVTTVVDEPITEPQRRALVEYLKTL